VLPGDEPGRKGEPMSYTVKLELADIEGDNPGHGSGGVRCCGERVEEVKL
jgi:hypothetical protein